MIFLMGSAVALHLEDANAFINSIFIACVHLFLHISLSLSLSIYRFISPREHDTSE